ncbi:MAG: WbqC family protein [Flavobacteriales bacterium]
MRPKRVAIMQPYVLPYIGYFQLIHASDAFVLLDDAAFIKRGWVNRNRILAHGKEHLFTIPVRAASQNVPINGTLIAPDDGWKRKLLATLEHAYRNAPGYPVLMPLLADLIGSADGSIADFAERSIRMVLRLLGIERPISKASGMALQEALRGQDRILAICQAEGAAMYINPPGGRELYQPDRFAERGIALRFIRVGPLSYAQGGAPFVPHLSIVDVLMWNSPEQARGLLHQYELEP